MSDFITVAKVGEIPTGEGAAFAVGGRMVAVFNVDGTYHAIDDFCPHMGASLSAGHVEDGTVLCPWHAWRFRLHDGAWTDNPKLCVDAFQVRVEQDNIQVALPATEPTDPVKPIDTAENDENQP